MAVNSSSSKNYIPMANKYDRVILLVDMDCFYCQVEEKLNPSLRGKPLAVVQYNAWRGGGIIAVNYAARSKGVTRHMRGDEAKEQCPEIELVKVPNVREKADLTKYREAGKDVANVLQRFTTLLERASVDEAYLDITDSVNKRIQSMNEGSFELQPKQLLHTYAVGYSGIGEFLTTITNTCQDELSNLQVGASSESEQISQINLRLLVGASIANEIRTDVKKDTGYECSAGIAHNKILAKLVCGLNKPNKQTILPFDKIQTLFSTLPLNKIKGLGGKFGDDIANQLNIQFVGHLIQFKETDLQRMFDEKNGTWLYNICRGIDLEAVTPRFYSKSIGCCKKFPGRNNITGIKTLEHWINELANEIVERLEKDIIENNRRAKQMVVSFVQELNGEDISSSRSCPLTAYKTEILIKNSMELIKNNTKQLFRTGSDAILNNPIKFLGISVGKFESLLTTKGTLQEMFANQMNNKEKCRNNVNIGLNDNLSSTLSVEVCSNEQYNNERLLKNYNKNTKSFFLNALLESSDSNQSEQINKNISTTKNDSPKSLHKQQQIAQNEQITASYDKDKENNSCELDKLIETLSNTSDHNNSSAAKYNNNLPSTSANAISNISIDSKDDLGYRLNYAEYATPQFHNDVLNFINCSTCNKKIPDDPVAIQMHQDYHFAFQISEQQRLEYRNQKKIKSPTSTSGAKRKAKRCSTTISNQVKKPLVGDITQFLKPSPNQNNTDNTDNTDKSSKINDNQRICDVCEQFVNKNEMQEHQDFHMAKDLQKRLNQLPVTTADINKVTTGSKRSQTSSLLNNQKQKLSSKSITHFFSQT